MQHEINERIRDREVRVVGPNGDMLGVMAPRDLFFYRNYCKLCMVNAGRSKHRYGKFNRIRLVFFNRFYQKINASETTGF